MYLKRLKLINFRNYEQQEVLLDPGLNCFTGENGMGKTNLLDAAYYLCMCRSYFGATDKVLVKKEEEFFRLEGDFNKDEDAFYVVSKYRPRRLKEFTCNKVKYDRLSEHIGILPVVMVAPDDTFLVTGGSEDRRKFIDQTLSQLDGNYLKQLIRYQKLLEQRNALLKDFYEKKTFDAALLEACSVPLHTPATYIHKRRQQFLTDFLPAFQALYEIISGDKEQVGCKYSSPLLELSMEDILLRNSEKDRIMNRTTSGIHKDDLIFTLNDQPLKRFASQGQLKSFLLALKLTQFQLLKNEKGVRPMLLLDDIFDKLDENRVKYLVELLMQKDYGQVLITDTSKNRISKTLKKSKAKSAFFEVIDGAVVIG